MVLHVLICIPLDIKFFTTKGKYFDKSFGFA